MTKQANFRDRDWDGLLINSGKYNFVEASLTNSQEWFCIQVGGPANIFPKKKLTVMGKATSPASLSATDIKENTLYLQVKHVPRGHDFDSASAKTQDYPILNWSNSETSTEQKIDTPIEIDLNTYGRTDGNIWIRFTPDDGGITFTDTAFVVCTYGNDSGVFTKESPTSETNNLKATGVNGVGNTVNEIPSSTAGYIEFKFTQFGHEGDVKTSNKVGLSPSAAIGSDPKYYWKFTEGDATGNTPLADAVHDGSVVANDIVCQEGDTLRVERDASGNYTYKKNGSTEGSGGSTDTTAQKGDFKLIYNNARCLGIRMDIGAGAVSPTFENLSNLETF